MVELQKNWEIMHEKTKKDGDAEIYQLKLKTSKPTKVLSISYLSPRVLLFIDFVTRNPKQRTSKRRRGNS